MDKIFLSTFFAYGASAQSGNGCCYNTVGKPSNMKLYDGPIATGGDCDMKCQHGGCVVTWLPSGGTWCTVWNPPFAWANCLPTETDTGDCGNDFSNATSYWLPPRSTIVV